MIRLTLKYLAVLLAACAALTAIGLGAAAWSNRRRVARVLAAAPVVVPAGRFVMGCAPGDGQCGADEPAAHPVELAAFSMDEFPVTNAAYKKCVDAGACAPPHGTAGLGGFWDALDPVTGVTWDQAVKFCAWRGGRLPSAAQWERAARGTGGRVWPWGDSFDASRACASIPPRRRDGPCAVDAFPKGASPDGVQDMAGNVWEWTADSYHPPSGPAAATEHEESAPITMVVKGGSWTDRESASLRASKQNAAAADSASFNVGFRCAYP